MALPAEGAEQAVRGLRGVVRVYNTVTIKPTASKTDVTTAINATLVRTGQSEDGNITAAVDHSGHGTLSGTLHSWSEQCDVERVAGSAPGVIAVTDELHIQY